MALSGTIVFSSGRSADLDIFTVNLETGEVRQLTSGNDQCFDMPRWSPDGTKIAYIHFADAVPGLWVMNADGSDKRQISKEVRYHQHPCWNKSGTAILVSANYGSGEDIDLWEVPLDGSAPRCVVADKGHEMEASWSPDGWAIALSSSRSGNDDIWEYRPGNKEWRQLTNHPGKDHCPRYSPDGRSIAFVSSREGWKQGPADRFGLRRSIPGDTDIWIMDSDGGNQRKLTSNQGSDKFVCWSPDSRYLVYCADSNDSTNAERLHFIDLQTHESGAVAYKRDAIESELGASAAPTGAFSRLMPERARRAFVGHAYFGTERYPDWKA